MKISKRILVSVLSLVLLFTSSVVNAYDPMDPEHCNHTYGTSTTLVPELDTGYHFVPVNGEPKMCTYKVVWEVKRTYCKNCRTLLSTAPSGYVYYHPCTQW